MPPILLVAIGGAAGSAARFALGGAFNPPPPTPNSPPWAAFPIGTLAVNLIGCALIGLLAGWLGVGVTGSTPPNPAWRPLLIVGVLGGFTTFSAFGIETVFMLRSGHYLPAGTYVLASTVLGITLASVGYAIATRVS